MTQHSGVAISHKVREFQVNGYVIFKNIISHELINDLLDAYLPYLDKEREKRKLVDASKPLNQLLQEQRYKRNNLEIHWIPPFNTPNLYAHPVLLEFLQEYGATTQYFLASYTSNTPDPGSLMQLWHRDLPLWTPNMPLQNAPLIAFKIPLIATSEKNGSTEIVPGTQYATEPMLERRFDEVVSESEFRLCARRLNHERGDAWILDPRCIHRGTPNNSEAPRPELVLWYALAWTPIPRPIRMSHYDLAVAEKLVPVRAELQK